MAHAPVINMAPPMVEVKNIFFKAHPIVSYFANDSEADAIENDVAFQHFNCSLECSNKHGCVLLTFNNTFYVLRVSDILSVRGNADNLTFNDLKKLEIKNDALPTTPNILSLSNGEEFLAVDTVRGDSAWIVVFKFSDFANQGGSCRPFCEIRCPSTTNSRISSVSWNPGDGFGNMIAINTDDGSLFLAKICGPSKFELNTLPGGGVRCCCWSPKGKQLVVGRMSGNISQLRLDLTEAKQISGPETGSVPISILWTQTTQFLIVFHKESYIDFMQLDVAKGSPPTYSNHGDFFISEVVPSKSSCYFLPLMQWNAVIAMTNTASDVVTLVKQNQNNTEIWLPGDITDNRRAAFLLDNYARGASLYFGSGDRVVFSEVETYSPMPIIFLLSQRGALIMYSVINTDPQLPPLNVNVSSPIPETLFSNIIAAPVPAYANPPSSFQIPATSQPPPSFFQAPAQTSTPPPKSTFFQPPVQSQTTAPAIPAQPQFFPPPQASTPPIKTVPAAQPLVPVDQSSKKTPKASAGMPMPQMPDLRQLGTSTLPSAQDMAGLQKAVEEKRREMTTQLQKGACLKGLEEDDQCVFVISEIRKFEQRLADFRANVESNRRNLVGLVNTSFDALEKRVLATLNVVEDFASDMVSTTSAQKEEVEVLKERILNHFSQLEYAKSLVERSRDPRYLEHLRTRPLDPTSQQKFEEIKKLHNYLKNQIAECRRYFYEQNTKRDMPLDRVSYTQLIYLTLSNHSKIIRRLKTELDSIKERLGLGRHNSSYEEGEYLAVCEATNNKKLSPSEPYDDPDEITLNDLTAGISKVKLNRDSDRPDKKPIKLPNRKLFILKKCMSNVVVVKVKADETPWTRSPSKTGTRPKPMVYPASTTAHSSLAMTEPAKNKPPAAFSPSQQPSINNKTPLVTLPTSSLTTDFGALFKSDATGVPEMNKFGGNISIGSNANNTFMASFGGPNSSISMTPTQMQSNTSIDAGRTSGSPSNQSPMLASLLATSVPSSSAAPAMPSFGTGAFSFGKPQNITPPSNKGTTLQSQSTTAHATTSAPLISFGSRSSTNASTVGGLTSLSSSTSSPSAASAVTFGTASAAPTGPSSVISFGTSVAPATKTTSASGGILTTPVSSTFSMPGFTASLNFSDSQGKKANVSTTSPSVAGGGLFSSAPLSNITFGSGGTGIFGGGGGDLTSPKVPTNTEASTTKTSVAIASTVSSVVSPTSTEASSPSVGFQTPTATTVNSGQLSSGLAATSPSIFGGGNISFGTPKNVGAGDFKSPTSSPVPSKTLFAAPQISASSLPSATTVSGTTATSPTNLFSTSPTPAPAPPTSSAAVVSTTSSASISTSPAVLSAVSPPSTTPAVGLFSSVPASAASTTGLFSSVPAATTSSGSLFAAVPATAATVSITPTSGLFSTAVAPSTGLFSSAAASTPPGGLFSSIPVSTAPTGAFSVTSSSTVPTGLFSSPPVTTASTGLFSAATTGTTTVTTTAGSIFGSSGPFSSSTTTTTQPATGFLSSLNISDISNKPGSATTGVAAGGLFSSSTFAPSTTSAAGIFGGGGSAFGSQSTTSGQTGSVTSTTQAGFGTFGQSTPPTGLFGTPATTTAQVFGGSAPFGGGSPFGSSFGGGSTFSSGNTNVFGNTAASTVAGFGALPQQSTTTSAFGGSPFGATAGQQQQSVFGSPTQQKPPGGLFSSTFGSPTATSTASAGVFGGGGSVFGGSTAAGAFSTGAVGVAQQGFGLGQNKPTTGAGFGSPAVFGGGASFGSTSPFGSSFASSPGSTFGTTGGTASVFGGGSGGNAGFGALAQQGSTSPGFGGGSVFGGSAQPQQQQQQSLFGSPQPQQQQAKPAFGGNTAFSSWR